MGVTKTPRLNLAKQVEADPDWHTGLNTGMDDADARLLKVSSDFGDDPDPNGDVAGDYVGQKYMDETADPPRFWICTTAGIAAAAVWELIGTTGIYDGVGVGGNNLLSTILADFQSRLAALELAVPAAPRGYIDGLIMSYVNTTTFGIAAGESADETQVRMLLQATDWTKTTASFVAGTGNGARATDIGSLGTSKWYHTFHMYEQGGSVTDIGLDDVLNHANLEATDAYDLFHRIGSIYIDGSGNIKNFFQHGNMVWWDDPPLYTYGAPTGTNVVTILTPPHVRTYAYIQARAQDNVNNTPTHFQSTEMTSRTPSLDASPLMTINPIGNARNPNVFRVMTNTSSQIEFTVFPGGTDDVSFVVLGYEDPRGRDIPV